MQKFAQYTYFNNNKEDSMSEDKTTAMTETVSESPATATTQDSSNEQYIAESKKYRKRAQDAEIRLAKLEKTLAKAEEAKLKEKEDFKSLYEKVSSDNESLTANAQKWNKYEDNRRNALLESVPEEERERLAALDLDTLEYVTNKVTSSKPNAPQVAGNPRGRVDLPKNWTTMSPAELRENWDGIINEAKNRSKQN